MHCFPEGPFKRTQNILKKSRFRRRRKTGEPGENPVWTGNQLDIIDIQRRDWESNPGSVVHSAEEVPLRPALYLLQPPVFDCSNLKSMVGYGKERPDYYLINLHVGRDASEDK